MGDEEEMTSLHSKPKWSNGEVIGSFPLFGKMRLNNQRDLANRQSSYGRVSYLDNILHPRGFWHVVLHEYDQGPCEIIY